jgi:hypothetical protein
VGRGGEEAETRFVIDSGTSHTVIDRRWAARKGVVQKDSSSAKLGMLRVGGFEASDVPVLLGEMKELPYEGEPVGVLGADLLLGLSVTYDFARDLVWLVSVDVDPKKESS